jgi:hypothetical protein
MVGELVTKPEHERMFPVPSSVARDPC